MIPECGFDSVPSDLLNWVVTRYIRTTFSLPTAEVNSCLYTVRGGLSGGTIASILNAFDQYPLRTLLASMAPYALSPVQPAHTATPKPNGIKGRLLGLWHLPELGPGYMAQSIQCPIDRAIVHRSWGLLSSSSETSYGENFEFNAWLRLPSAPVAVIWHGLYTALGFLFLLPPVRWALKKVAYAPGEGMSKEGIKKSRFEYRALGMADGDGGGKALGRFKYYGDAYYFTGIALAQAAMVVLGGEGTEAHRAGGGVFTSAMLGGKFVERLRGAGVVVEAETFEAESVD